MREKQKDRGRLGFILPCLTESREGKRRGSNVFSFHVFLSDPEHSGDPFPQNPPGTGICIEIRVIKGCSLAPDRMDIGTKRKTETFLPVEEERRLLNGHESGHVLGSDGIKSCIGEDTVILFDLSSSVKGNGLAGVLEKAMHLRGLGLRHAPGMSRLKSSSNRIRADLILSPRVTKCRDMRHMLAGRVQDMRARGLVL